MDITTIAIWLLCGVIGGVLGAVIVITCQAAYERRIARRLMARWDEDLTGPHGE